MAIRVAECHLKSTTPYSQSKFHATPKLDKEGPNDWEIRTWRERMHYDPNTFEVYVPPMQFKKCVEGAADFLGMKIPGRGRSTYSKHFLAGVMVSEPLMLGVKRDEVRGEWLLLNADGKRGGNTRVQRCMPIVDQWAGVVRYFIIDGTINNDVFETHLREAGSLIGIGRFRPRVGGFLGQFQVERVEWR